MTQPPPHKLDDDALAQLCDDAIFGVVKPTFHIGKYLTDVTFPGEPTVFIDNTRLLRAFIEASGSAHR